MSSGNTPIPFTVIGGFLGAGKTTFVNQLLAQQDIPRLTILVNDFGDIVIDEALIAEHDGDTIALKNGCVCCSIGGDFSSTLSRVIKSQPRPEHILVEVSGVANPAKVMDIARISTDLQPEATLVMVDASGIREQLQDRWIADTVRTQLASADLLVFSKISRQDSEQTTRLLEQIGNEFPGIPLTTEFEQSWCLFNDLNVQQDGDIARQVHTHFETRTVVTEQCVDPARLKIWLAERGDVYRVKGWLKTSDETFQLFHAVGRHVTTSETDRCFDATSTLLMIGRPGIPDSDDILKSIVVLT